MRGSQQQIQLHTEDVVSDKSELLRALGLKWSQLFSNRGGGGGKKPDICYHFYELVLDKMEGWRDGEMEGWKGIWEGMGWWGEAMNFAVRSFPGFVIPFCCSCIVLRSSKNEKKNLQNFPMKYLKDSKSCQV